MALWLDAKYARLISPHLPLFTEKGNGVFNFRCVVCGDSKTDKFKKRGFLFKTGDHYIYKCHNCSYSARLDWFLKKHFPSVYSEYLIDLLNDKGKRAEGDVFVPPEPERIVMTSVLDSLLERVDTLPDDHPAVQYCAGRLIPHEWWSKLYYIDRFSRIEQVKSADDEVGYGKEPRLIIPFHDRHGKLVGLAGRALGDNSRLKKYMTVRLVDRAPLWFGTDTFDSYNDGYVVEGPIDSMFLPNAIAVGNTDLLAVAREFDVRNATFVFDNQPRNPEIVKQVRKAVYKGHKVCIWPDTDVVKQDINGLVLSGVDVKRLIDDNTYNGLKAQIAFENWSKV